MVVLKVVVAFVKATLVTVYLIIVAVILVSNSGNTGRGRISSSSSIGHSRFVAIAVV